MPLVSRYFSRIKSRNLALTGIGLSRAPIVLKGEMYLVEFVKRLKYVIVCSHVSRVHQ